MVYCYKHDLEISIILSFEKWRCLSSGIREESSLLGWACCNMLFQPLELSDDGNSSGRGTVSKVRVMFCERK
jgi:hypothetical protein